MTIKGQILMPKSLRDRTGIKPGTRLEWSIDELGRPLLIKLPDQTDAERRADIEARLDAAFGQCTSSETTDAFMNRMRDPLP
jgi:AbrB family looped-hinge helix DNA binding protein